MQYKCKNCGRIQPPTVPNFCLCGFDLWVPGNAVPMQNEPVQAQPQPQPKKKRGCLTGCLTLWLIILAIAAVGALFPGLFNQDSPRKTSPIVSHHVTKRVQVSRPKLRIKVVTAEQLEKNRIGVIGKAILRGKEVVSDKSLCPILDRIVGVWKNLRLVLKTDKEFKEAKKLARRLERCRRKAKKVLSVNLRKFMIYQRKTYAERFERIMLSKGADLRAIVYGDNKDKLKLVWILWSRPTVYNLIKSGEFLKKKQDIGFRKVVFHTGYHYWEYKLEPDSEKEAVEKVLRDKEMDKPLRLPVSQ